MTWLALGASVTLAVYLLTRSNRLAVRIPGPPGGNWITGERSIKRVFRQGILISQFQDILETFSVLAQMSSRRTWCRNMEPR